MESKREYVTPGNEELSLALEKGILVFSVVESGPAEAEDVVVDEGYWDE